MTTIAEAIDAIYDAKRGCFRDLGGEPVTADNLPREGDLLYDPQMFPVCIYPVSRDWTERDLGPLARAQRILRRAEQPPPVGVELYYGGTAKVLGTDGELHDVWPGEITPEQVSNDGRLIITEGTPDRIYFPWPSGIDGIIGVIGPRIEGYLQGPHFRQFYPNGETITHSGPTACEQFGNGICRFPADADLRWVRDESEVPADLLAEAKERGA